MKTKDVKILIISIISIIILACVFGITLSQEDVSGSSNITNVQITYKSNSSEDAPYVTINTDVVDKDINQGRAWISNLETIMQNNSEFIAPEGKTFIGWQYESSTINSSVVTNTSVYKSGDHFTQDEYYSLTENETSINLVAVWGYTVYVDGVNGFDDADGINSPVRTMGRAYEVLAQLDSGNSEGNITGFKVTGDSKTGYSYGEEDTSNLITNFNGKIVIIDDVNYSNKTEGRYLYITYGDLINSENYDSSTGIVNFDDGVSGIKIEKVNAITGYSENDPVKINLDKNGKYIAKNKTLSGSCHFILQKVLNNYSYELNGKTYYTYGRLTQYTENLRAHVGKGVMTPENNGLVLITSKNEETSYDAIFEFGEYTRYASGGDLIYKDITLSFYHNTSEDGESIGYVGGYAANGNYLAIDENVSILDDSKHDVVNIYGGAHSYRYNSNKYSGAAGNNLGNSGKSVLENTRITIKSGKWSAAYSGSYGSVVGQNIGTYGTNEKNAAVLSIYGGTFTAAGMGHEGASAYNSYIYIYGGTYTNVHGSGYGSTGSMTGGGTTNLLISGATTRISKVYGGSSNGSHTSNNNIVINSGTISNTLFGGNSKTDVNGNIKIKVNGGTIKSIIGGCETGSVKGKVSIDITGGVINGTIYTSGQGGTATTSKQYYVGNSTDVGLNAQILDKNSSILNILITGDSAADAPAIQDAAKNLTSQTKYYNQNQYVVAENAYYYPHIYSSDFGNLLAGYGRSTYKNHGPTQYTIVSYVSTLSLATVSAVELNITGGEINGNIYGGGKVAVVEGDVNINIANAKVNGNVYGGGDGTVEPTVTLYRATSANTHKSETYTWKGTDTFNISEYDNLDNVPIDYENKYVYSPSYDYMGGVKGNIKINIEENSTISGNVYGGGNAGEVNSSEVIISNSIVNGNVYGGGYSGKVATSTNMTFTDVQTTEVFGGGYSGNIDGNTKLTINSGTYTNVFAGCDQAVVGGSTEVIVGNLSNPNITISETLYGGGRGVDVDGDGNASDFCTVEGTSNVTIEGINTNVKNYGSVKLGNVKGNVDVTFINYWTGNATNKYKVMNGIDRATNVYMIGSYTWLENEAEDGTRQGIENIENLNIPDGSGMKISANGNITGNFNGGGELYLDSEVCLTVNGDITGQTKLILNPALYEGDSIIKGSADVPYIIVNGSSAEDSVISGDSRYTIVSSLMDGNERKYYIENDVFIDNTKETITLKEGKQYSKAISDWTKTDIQIEQDGVLTAYADIYYEYKLTEDFGDKYQNLSRNIIIKSGDTQVNIPINTKIIMLTNNEYYSLDVDTTTNKIPLNSFVSMEDGTSPYEELNDITEVSTGDQVIKLYHYSENFRFIIDFSDATENLLETGKTYNVLLEVNDKGVNLEELSYVAENTIIMNEKRNISYNYEFEKENYLQNENVVITGTLNFTNVKDTVYNRISGKQLTAKVILKDNENNTIKNPIGTILKVNGQKIKENELALLLDNISKEELQVPINIELNMKNVLQKNTIPEGNYSFELQLVIDRKTEQIFTTTQFKIKSYDESESGIKVSITKEDANSDIAQLITKEDGIRKIILNYSGNLNEPNVKVKLYKKSGVFEYLQLENNIIQEKVELGTNYLGELQQKEEIITLNASLLKEEGTYRILFELYDGEDIKITEEKNNFIVKK